MEIFKVASQQIDNSVALNTKQNSNQTREVEQAKIQQNVAQERSNQNKGNNEQDSKRISDIVNKLNDNMETLNTNIRFGFNDKTSSMYVSVTEADSGKVIRKIPTEEIMKLTEHFKEIVGVIFDKKE
ncbi:TPA: flagellar protein FlaG [Campylobacter fetus subsp. venerealis]|nr:flagellar protein FlaG [Campylobacter fetus subsp. venerealis]